MSIASLIASLSTSINTYYPVLVTAIKKKTNLSSLADNATKLGGKTPAELNADVAPTVTGHTGRKDNPHGETAASIGTFTIAESDALLNKIIPQGILPISRFGSLDYLPVGVSGSFEGATTVKDTGTGAINQREQYSFQLEDNGTLVFLRNGTNGSVLGAYYGYIAKAASTFVGAKIVVTGTRYRPPFLAIGQEVAYIYQGGTGVVAGRIMESNDTLGQAFIALTNGSLDAAGHTGVFLAATEEAKLNVSECVIGKDYVYLLATPSPESAAFSNPVAYTLYRVKLADFGLGKTVVPEAVTIGQSTGFLDAVFNDPAMIRFADVSDTNAPGTPALVYHNNGTAYFQGGRIMTGSGRMMTQSAFNADKTIMRTLCYWDGRYSAPGKGLQSMKFLLSFTFNILTGEAALDPACRQPLEFTLAGDGTIAMSTGGIRDTTGILEGASLFDYSYRTYFTESGLFFTGTVSYSAANLDTLHRAQLSSFTSVFDALQVPLVSRSSSLRISIPVSYGSECGDSFDSLRLLGDNQAMVYCRRSTGGQSLVKIRYAPSGAPAAPNSTYKSVKFGTLSGYKPRTERVAYPNLAEHDLFRGCINEVDDNGTTCLGSVLSESFRQSRPININADFTTVGTVDCTLAQLQALKATIIATYGLQTVKTSSIELVIPQKAGTIPYAVTMVVEEDYNRRFFITKVNLSSRTGTIASMTDGGLILNYSIGINVGSSVSYSTDNIRSSSIHMYEVPEGFMVAGETLNLHALTSGSNYMAYRFFVNRDGSTQGAGGGTAGTSQVGTRYGAMPLLGLGNVYATDYYTKLIWRKVAKTKAEFLTWVSAAENTSVVIVSQDVAEGWIVYFTDTVPVIISGRSFTLSNTSFDLSVLFPGNYTNKTFYVYVSVQVGVAQYRLSLTKLNESESVMWIGTIKTSASAITEIDIDKVTRLDTYRLSNVSRGSAIPVSSGLPSAAATLSWS
jgi:hypothetical protein